MEKNENSEILRANKLVHRFIHHGHLLEDSKFLHKYPNMFFVRMIPWNCPGNGKSLYHDLGVDELTIRDSLIKKMIPAYSKQCKIRGCTPRDTADRPTLFAYVNTLSLRKAKFMLDFWIVSDGVDELDFIESGEFERTITDSNQVNLRITPWNLNGPWDYHFKSTRLYRTFNDKFDHPIIV